MCSPLLTSPAESIPCISRVMSFMRTLLCVQYNGIIHKAGVTRTVYCTHTSFLLNNLYFIVSNYEKVGKYARALRILLACWRVTVNMIPSEKELQMYRTIVRAFKVLVMDKFPPKFRSMSPMCICCLNPVGKTV